MDGLNEYVVLSGNGSVALEDYTFVQKGSDSVATQMAFMKDGSGQYQLKTLSFNGQEVPAEGIKVYWDSIVMPMS